MAPVVSVLLLSAPASPSGSVAMWTSRASWPTGASPVAAPPGTLDLRTLGVASVRKKGPAEITVALHGALTDAHLRVATKRPGVATCASTRPLPAHVSRARHRGSEVTHSGRRRREAERSAR